LEGPSQGAYLVTIRYYVIEAEKVGGRIKNDVTKEMNNMSNEDQCKRLRKLRTNLVNELKTLKENVNAEEQEGVENPVETVNIIKSLQQVLSHIDLELEKCPPED
jgi:hypothetical protein